MEGLIILIVILIVVAAFAFAIVKSLALRKLKETARRSTQGYLNSRIGNALSPNIPSDSEINQRFNSALSQKATNKFIEEHPNYTKEQIRDIFMSAGLCLVNGTVGDLITQSLINKTISDKKMNKMGPVQIKYAYLLSYAMNRYAVMVIADNGSNEYNISLFGATDSNGFREVEKYTIQKGIATGM